MQDEIRFHILQISVWKILIQWSFNKLKSDKKPQISNFHLLSMAGDVNCCHNCTMSHAIKLRFISLAANFKYKQIF